MDIICILIESSKKGRMDSSARWNDIVGSLVIKPIENFIALLLLGSY